MLCLLVFFLTLAEFTDSASESLAASDEALRLRAVPILNDFFKKFQTNGQKLLICRQANRQIDEWF